MNEITNWILNYVNSKDKEQKDDKNLFNLGYYMGCLSHYLFLLQKIDIIEKDKIRSNITDTDIMLVYTMLQIENEFEELKILRCAQENISEEKQKILDIIHSDVNKKMRAEIMKQIRKNQENIELKKDMKKENV